LEERDVAQTVLAIGIGVYCVVVIVRGSKRGSERMV
jgi:hypothetical protein